MLICLSIDAEAQVVIILLACRPYMVIVNYLGQVLYLGRAPRTKETLPDFRECRVGYPTSTSIPQVDGLSTNTPVLGHHRWASPNWLDILEGRAVKLEASIEFRPISPTRIGP